MSPDVIFGLIIFVGVIYLVVNTMKLSGTKMDDEILGRTPRDPNDPKNEPPFHDQTKPN
jgi:hypothetical protein